MDFQNSYLPAGMIPTGTVPGGIAAIGLMDERIHNENSYRENAHLTEAQKEELIFKYKDDETDSERERIMDSVPPDEDISGLFGGPSIG